MVGYLLELVGFQTTMATTSTFFTLTSKTPLKTLTPSNFLRRDCIFTSNLLPNNFLKKKKKKKQEVGFSSSNSNLRIPKRFPCISCKSLSTAAVNTTNYEFSDGGPDVELRLHLRGNEIQDSRDVIVDADGTSLAIKLQSPGSTMTLLETDHLYDNIKPSETIWYIDEDQLVINLKKHDPDLKWPDIMESWESLTVGALQILKASSVYIVGESTEINQAVARELAVGLGYSLLNTSELLEAFGKGTIDSWVIAEGVDSVIEAESAILESLSSHVRAVVATLGGVHGAAGKADKWRHLYSGFTIWLSQSETADEDSAKEEARRQIKDGSRAYSNADVVVKLGGWDPNHAQTAAQACLSGLKRLILSDKKLPGKKSLYIRLGCRGDWPNIKPPGWDPSSGADTYGET